MRILVTNDDGVYADGINVLRDIAQRLSDDVWVVAPEHEQSGMAHSLSLRKPLRIRQLKERKYAVDGTPTDAVLAAMQVILADKKPDLVLSGVNHGSNLGEDVTYSGTVAAAMEAALLDRPAMALSQCYEGKEIDWSAVITHGEQVIRSLLKRPCPPKTLYNINFPPIPASDVKGVQLACQGLRHLSDNLIENRDPENEPYYWIGRRIVEGVDPEGSDYAAVAEGFIAVTPIHVDMTHHEIMDQLRAINTRFT